MADEQTGIKSATDASTPPGQLAQPKQKATEEAQQKQNATKDYRKRLEGKKGADDDNDVEEVLRSMDTPANWKAKDRNGGYFQGALRDKGSMDRVLRKLKGGWAAGEQATADEHDPKVTFRDGLREQLGWKSQTTGHWFVHAACASGSVDILDWIIQDEERKQFAGDIVSCPTDDGSTPMMIAIASSLEKIKVRLASSTLPTLKADSIAADAVDMAIADWLYKKDTSTLEAEGKHGITPMLRLCVTDDSTLAEPLRMMADWLHEKNENLIRQTTSVAFKLGEGMPKSVISGAGYSPVHVAGASGNLTMIQWLNSKLGTSEDDKHKNKCILAEAPKKYTTMHLVSMQATDSSFFVSIAPWLLDISKDLVKATDEDGMTPLHHACKHGNVDMAHWLKKSGGDIHARDNSDKTPLDHVKHQLEKLGDGDDGESGGSRRQLEKLKIWLSDTPQPRIDVGSYAGDDRPNTKQHSTHVPKAKGLVQMRTEDLALGTLFVGLPGSGKTYGMKRFVEKLTDLSSMRAIVILDIKGDWSQMLERSTSKIPRVVEEANRFESKCDVHLYTFGSDHGWPATLDPFVNLGGDPAYCDETGKEKAYEKLTRDAKCKLHGEIRIFVVDLLTSVALIKVDEKGGEILASNNIPSLLKRSLQHVSLEDKKVLATDLVSAVWQISKRFYEKKHRMPETYEEMYSEIEEVAKELEPQPQPEVLAKALKSGFLWQKAIGWVKEHTGSQAQQVKEHSGSQAQQPASAQPAEAGSSAAAMERQVVTEGRKVQLSPSLDHEDLRYVANTIRAEVGGPLSELYAKATGDINDPKDTDVYRLNEDTLLKKPNCNTNEEKQITISIVQLFNLKNDMMKQRVVHTILERLERSVEHLGGSQAAPKTAIVIDEAHLAMPSAARGDALDYGSSGVVRRILRLRRSCGTVLVLGTQFPRDLNKQVLAMIRIRFIGGGIAGKPEECGALAGKSGKEADARTPQACKDHGFRLQITVTEEVKKEEEEEEDVKEDTFSIDAEMQSCYPFNKGEAANKPKFPAMTFGQLVRQNGDSGKWTTDDWAWNGDHPLRKACDPARQNHLNQLPTFFKEPKDAKEPIDPGCSNKKRRLSFGPGPNKRPNKSKTALEFYLGDPEVKKRILHEDPEVKNAEERKKKAREEWKQMGEEEKNPWYKQAEEAKAGKGVDHKSGPSEGDGNVQELDDDEEEEGADENEDEDEA